MVLKAHVSVVLVVWFAILHLGATPVVGLQYNPQDYPPDVNCFDHPPENVSVKIVQTFGGGPTPITGTVVAPNYIVTVAHWSIAHPPYTPGEVPVVVPGDGNVYQLVDEKEEDSQSRDLAVYRIVKCTGPGSTPEEQCTQTENANFPNWVDLYDVPAETGAELAIASYGPQQGTAVPAGTLHYGRNLVTSIGAGDLEFMQAAPGMADYIRYEAEGIPGDSGAGAFIKVGLDWRLASPLWQIHHGNRSSEHAAWITAQIDAMNAARPVGEQETNPRPPAPAAAIQATWEGLNSCDWSHAANWDNGPPTAEDAVVVDTASPPGGYCSPHITMGTALADELIVGNAYTGELVQTEGSLTARRLCLGVKPGAQGMLTLGAVSLSVEDMQVGVAGSGMLDMTDSAATLLPRSLFFRGANTVFNAVQGATIRIVPQGDCGIDRLMIGSEVNPANMAGLGNVTLRCEFPDDTGLEDHIVRIERAGAYAGNRYVPPPSDYFSTDNFVIDTLVVGRDAATIDDTAGRVVVCLVDTVSNRSGSDVLYVRTLEINAGATFLLQTALDSLYYLNDDVPKRLYMGDANLDGVVDSTDIAIVHQFTVSGASWSDGDFDGDRDVDSDDVAILRKNLPVLYVNASLPDGSGADDGTTWEHAFRSTVGGQGPLQRAIAAASGGAEEIWVAGGRYTPTADGDRNKSFLLRSGLQILGGFNGSESSKEDRRPAQYVTILSGDLNNDDLSGFVNRSDNSYHVLRAQVRMIPVYSTV